MNAYAISSSRDLKKVCRDFARGCLSPIVIVGPTGCTKTESLLAAMGKKKFLYIDSVKTAINLYVDLYRHRGWPILLDDTLRLLGNLQAQELIKCLMNPVKRRILSWGTSTKVLDELGIPKQFTTTSTLCILSNRIGSGGLWPAMKSRCHVFNVKLGWKDICADARSNKWCTDTIVLNYALHHATCQPDARKLTNGVVLKELQYDWKQLFHGEEGKPNRAATVAELLQDPTLTPAERCNRFVSEGHGSRAAFFRWQKKVGVDASLTETSPATLPAKKNKNRKTAVPRRGRKRQSGRRNIANARKILGRLGRKSNGRKRGAA
jgi:hypothetical protein